MSPFVFNGADSGGIACDSVPMECLPVEIETEGIVRYQWWKEVVARMMLKYGLLLTLNSPPGAS